MRLRQRYAAPCKPDFEENQFVAITKTLASYSRLMTIPFARYGRQSLSIVRRRNFARFLPEEEQVTRAQPENPEN